MAQDKHPQALISIPGAARILGVSVDTVYDLCNNGTLDSGWLGETRLVFVSSLNETIANLPRQRPEAGVTA